MQIYFPYLAQLKDLLPLMQFKPKKWTTTTTPQWSIPLFSNWNIWMFTQTCWCIFTWVCQCYLEIKRARGPSPFCLGYFSPSKNFNYVAKDVNIFHLKLGNSSKLSYFPTSTLSKYTPPSPWLTIWLTYYKLLVIEVESFWHLIFTNLKSFKLSFVFKTYVHFSNMWCVF